MRKALLIVHGIGEQRPGETTEKLVAGLSAAFGDALTVERDPAGHATGVRALGHDVRFHEVYWADLLSRSANRGSLTFATLQALPWQPLACRRAGLLEAAEYPAALVAGWLALLVPASLLAFPLSYGARAIVQLFDRERQARIEARARALPFWQRARELADASAHEETMLEAAMESVAADVPSYMQSIACGEGVALEVLARFHAAMDAARADAGEVHVLAHSLGTVVAYHALTGLGHPRNDGRYAPRRLFTIGSPLEKIRFFWPWTIRRTAPSGDPAFRWLNFYHRLDGVSGRLRRFEAWAPVTNVRLKGGGGMLRSHVVYERSPEFLGAVTQELFGARVKDVALTAAENLALPAALAIALAIGLAAVAAVVFAVPLGLWWLLPRIGVPDAVTWAAAGILVAGTAAIPLLALREAYVRARANVARGQGSRGPAGSVTGAT